MTLPCRWIRRTGWKVCNHLRCNGALVRLEHSPNPKGKRNARQEYGSVGAKGKYLLHGAAKRERERERLTLSHFPLQL